MSTERKLATIEKILSIRPIEGADSIVCARVRGWDVVVKKDEFLPGEFCVYFEVDSFLDVNDPRFAFLAPRGVRTDATGRSGHALKTAKLRGQYSQGLAVKTGEFPELGEITDERVGEDVSDTLNVVKWDAPIPAELNGKVRGYLPGWITSTDEERVQNLEDILSVRADWVATEKLDGTSTTFYVDGDLNGVCTRNLDLLEDPQNTLWRLAEELDIFAKIRGSGLGDRVVVQGEAFGEGIQKNPLRLKGQHFRVFTIRVGSEELPRGKWPQWAEAMSVPVHELSFPTSLEEALTQVEKLKSKISPERAAEGVVWRAADTSIVNVKGTPLRASFKVISNGYLLKNDR